MAGGCEETHEVAANLSLLPSAFHLAGVAFASFEHRENLVRSVFTGRKRAE
jgi:cytochrome b